MRPRKQKEIHPVEAKPNIKILILGTLDSGKTTLFTHMKWGGKEPEEDGEEKKMHVSLVHGKVASAIHLLMSAAENHFNLDFSPRSEEAIQRFRNFRKTLKGSLTPCEMADIQTIWADEAIQQILTRKYELEHYLPDSTEHLVTSISRIAAPNYLPSSSDILHTCSSTVGITYSPTLSLTPADLYSARLRTPSLPISPVDVVAAGGMLVYDAGGTRTERRKWVHVMQDDLSQVVFVVSLSDYDQTLRENEIDNRMHESLTLFSEISKHPFLSHVPLILLFSKDDLFREKISRVSLRACFPEYTGKDEYSDARDYIIEKYLACTKKEKISQVLVGNLTDIPFMVDVVSYVKGCALHSWVSRRNCKS